MIREYCEQDIVPALRAARNVGIISTVSDIRELAMGLDVRHFNWDGRGDVVEEGSDAWIIRIRVASLAKIK